jgi:hypothetical protein
LDDTTRTYLLETFTLKGHDLNTLSTEDLLQFMLRLANITWQLDEISALLAPKCRW